LVTETSFEGLRNAPHSLQNLESSGFSVLHLEHLIVMIALIPFRI
jgi:hypothetical protein